MTQSPYQTPRSQLIDRPVNDVFPIEHEAFAGRGFALRPPGFFKRSTLVIDGAEIPGNGRRYSVRDNSGNMVEVRLKSSGLDPVPRVVIGDRKLQVARPLAWYEYVPLALSWVLLPLGGALGVLVGVTATVLGARVLRSDRPPAMRLALATSISTGAVLLFFAVAVLAGILLGVMRHGS